MGKWNFLSRTTPGIAHLLKPLEEIIQKEFLPALTGCNAPSAEERHLMALPTRLGGLGLLNSTTLDKEHRCSTSISNYKPFVALIDQQEPNLDDAPNIQQQIKSSILSDNLR